MLPKKNRLPYSVRLISPKQKNHNLFIVKYAANSIGEPRFRIIIAKRIEKSAVKRNRMRRVLHQLIQEQLAQFPSGYDYLFLVKKPFATLSEEDKKTLLRSVV